MIINNNKKIKEVISIFLIKTNPDDNMANYYNNSINKLVSIINENEIYPNELNWNRLAVKEKLLSAETIGYIYKDGFNKLCRRILIQLNRIKKK